MSICFNIVAGDQATCKTYWRTLNAGPNCNMYNNTVMITDHVMTNDNTILMINKKEDVSFLLAEL
jgi:hypothetical protein